MIIENQDPKETLGENLGKASKEKINKIIYWIIGVVILGGLSTLFLFSRGFIKGWKSKPKLAKNF